MNFKMWLKGLVASVVGGAAGSLGLLIAEPAAMSDLSKLWKVALVGALSHLVMYLQKSPVPDGEGK